MNASGNSLDNLNNWPPKKALLAMRIMWAVLLFGPLAFMGVIILVILPNTKRPIPPQPLLPWLSAGLLLTIVPAALLIRRLIHGRARDEKGIPPAAFSTAKR